MKYLIFTDPHIHTWRRFGHDDETGLSRRLKEQQSVLEQIDVLRQREKPDRVICGGDIFHKVGEIPIECSNIALQYPKLWDIIVPGNHDLVDLKNPKWFQYSGHIFGVSSCPAGIKTIGYTDEIDYEVVSGYDIVFLHKTPTGSRDGHWVFDDGADWRTLMQNNGLVFFGHIHQHQQLGERCWVVGSPMKHKFGDDGDRGVMIVDGTDVRFIKLKYPDFITVPTWDDVTDDYNYYRVENSDRKSDKQNVVAVTKPVFYEERVKSDNFMDILEEWVEYKNVGDEYFKVASTFLKEKMLVPRNIYKGKLRHVKINNFMSVEQAEYKVGRGSILVTGKTDEFDSNGAGKTSVTGEAIYWGLFGQTTKGLKGDDVIRRDTKDCTVSLTFDEGDSNTLRIVRSRKKGFIITRNDVTLFEGERLPDKQKKLEEEILGFGQNVFRSSCYFSQESLMMLTGLSDTEKTNMITDLLGFEQYDELYDTAANQIRAIEVSKTTLADDADAHVVERDKLRVKHGEMILSMEEKELELEGVSNDIDKATSEISELRKQIAELKNMGIDDTDYDLRISQLRSEASALTEKGEHIAEDEDKLNEDTNTIVGDAGKIQGEICAHSNTVVQLRDEMISAQNLVAGHKCTKCGAAITEDSIDSFITDKEKTIDERGVIVNDLRVKLSALKEQEQSLRELSAELKAQQSLISDTCKKKRDEEDALNEAKKRQEKEKSDRDRKCSTLESEISECDGVIKSAESRTATLKAAIVTAEKETKAVDDKITQENKLVEGCLAEITDLQSQVTIFDFWKDAFSPRGIRSVLLDRFCNEFNEVVNEYLTTISNGAMTILLTPTKSLKSGEERNKIGMDIGLGDHIVSYEGLSGGEKRRIDIALCLSLNSWVSKKYNIPNGLLGILILDELFSFVDRTGEEAIGTLIYNEGVNKTVFVISHTPELGSYVNDIWRVVKEKGVSRLEKEGGVT